MNKKVGKIFILAIAIASVIYTFGRAIAPALTTPEAENVIPEANFARYFQQLGVEGSIIIYDAQSDKPALKDTPSDNGMASQRIYQYNQKRNGKAFLPASTFKILNSLISLETKVIDDEIAVLTWDGIDRPTVAQWNQDLNMRQAFKFSAVWFYQVLARRVGHKKMQAYVNKSDYGNQDIGSQTDIDTFWLTGELRITPEEQIQFLHRLHNNDLPFSERSLSIVKDIMIVEQTPEYTIRAKTGLIDFGEEAKPQIGWYVGYLEKGKNVYFFATNIDVRNNRDLATRIDITRRCFEALQLL